MSGRLRGAALAAAWAVLLLTGAAAAQERTTAFELDALDARAFAMGGTLVALPHDETAMRWNPALLVWLPGPAVTAGYSTPAADLGASHGAVAAAMPLGRLVPDMPPEAPMRRSAGGVLLMSSGFDLSEGARWSETQVGVGYAHEILSYLSVGGSLRVLGNSTAADQASVSGYSVDIAAAMPLTGSVRVGAVFRNILSNINWKDLNVSESLPNVFVLGGALQKRKWDAEVGLQLAGSSSSVGYGGAEYALRDGMLKLRLGTRVYFGAEPRSVPTAGVGLNLGSLRVDLGAQFDAADALGTTKAVSLGYRFR